MAVTLQPECALCSDKVSVCVPLVSHSALSTGTEGFATLLLMHSESPCREGDGADEGFGSRSSGMRGIQASEMQLWILSIHC